MLARGVKIERTSFSARFCAAESSKLLDEAWWYFPWEVWNHISTAFWRPVVRISSQELEVVDLELDVADQVCIAATDGQCESGYEITVDTKRAVLIKSVLPFFAELARYLEHGGAWRWGLEETHSRIR